MGKPTCVSCGQPMEFRGSGGTWACGNLDCRMYIAPLKDGLGFVDAAIETQRLFGDPPLIGTFTPTLGDIGRDAEGFLWVWDGKQFIDGTGRRGKTFDEWMGLV